MELKEHNFITEVNRELEFARRKLVDYYWGYNGEARRESHWMGVAYAKYKCTLLCALIAHSRGAIHLAGCSFEEQEHFINSNKHEWEYILHRTVRKEPVAPPPKPALRKSFVQQLREMLV